VKTELVKEVRTMPSTVTAKGQVTIPKPIRDALGIGPKDHVAFIREGEKVFLQPRQTLKALRGVVKSKGAGSFQEERSRAKAAVAIKRPEYAPTGNSVNGKGKGE